MKSKKLLTDIAYKALMHSSLLRGIYLRRRFCDEQKLELEGPAGDLNPHPSVIHFTLHKCASVFVSQVLEILARNSDMRFANLPAYFSHSGKDKLQMQINTEPNIVSDLFSKQGYVYAALRHPQIVPLVEEIDDYKIVLVLRDPRDKLISTYYSTGYTHRMALHPNHRGNFAKYREKVGSRTVDDYVLEEYPMWLERYELYVDNLLNRPNVLLLKFEDMVTDFDEWMDHLFNFVDLDVDRSVLARVERKFKEKSRPLQNRRANLEPETIEILNDKFERVIQGLGYDL